MHRCSALPSHCFPQRAQDQSWNSDSQPGRPDGDGLGDLPGGEGELLDAEVGDERSGRLVAPDEGAHEEGPGAIRAEVGA